jgi:pyridoxal phosphate enzyme (YggS family)
MSLQHNLSEVNQRITEACLRSGRNSSEVQVIAVTKYVSIDKAREVLDAGLPHIGENRWQDAKSKWDALQPRGIWHFIGHLQSNKVKEVIDKFTYIHSLDRLSLAKEVDKAAALLGITARCFVQVNVSGEASKFGLAPGDVPAFLKELSAYPNLYIEGLMTMAPLEMEAETTRPVFRGLRELRDHLNEQGILPYAIKGLSMGMSGDFEIAIEEGATWVRLGTVLVGKS